MPSLDRRVFVIHVAASAAAATVPAVALAAEAVASDVPVKETDAYPKSMGYKVDTANVDKAKFPRHDVSQKCSECQLYSGKPGDALGPCSFFKRPVTPGGWCRNFKPKKAA
jgi:hypothetical protein